MANMAPMLQRFKGKCLNQAKCIYNFFFLRIALGDTRITRMYWRDPAQLLQRKIVLHNSTKDFEVDNKHVNKRY